MPNTQRNSVLPFPLHAVLATIFAVALPLLSLIDYTDEKDLFLLGHETQLLVHAQTGMTSKGYVYYKASIAGIPVQLRTKKSFQPGYSYPAIYSRDHLEEYARNPQGAFYAFIIGTKDEGFWQIYQRDAGRLMMLFLFGLEIFFIYATIKLWREHLRPNLPPS